MASGASSVPQAHKSLTAARCIDGAEAIRRAFACCSKSETASGMVASERHALKIHLLPSKRPQGFAPKHATAQECNARGLIVAFLLLAFDRQIDLGSPRAPPPRRDATRLYRTPTRAADPYCSRCG